MKKEEVKPKTNLDIEIPIRCTYGLMFCIGIAHQSQMRKREKENNSKTNKMKTIIIALLLFTCIGTYGQDEETDSKTIPFQLTLVSPIGTNGINCGNVTNRVSVNLFAGYAGGLSGVELSGFASVLLNQMNGAQLSGFSNVTLGNGKGAQLSGFCNYNKGTFNGAQLTGFANVTNNDCKAAQLAGFANVTVGSMAGAQVSGFANVATQNTTAVQAGGFANVSKGEATGSQISGFANYSQGNKIGQFTGFTNVNTGDLKGVQAAGFANVNTGDTDGAQISGFVNVTRKLNGVQLGVFNYVDSLEKGVPIGVFSVVRNGYRAFEVSASETLYGIASFKTGTKNFYNIISVGATARNNMLLWGWGYGIGTSLTLSEKMNMGIEVISYHINEDEWFTDRLNMLNKLQITESFSIADHCCFFGGLSWNVVVSDAIHDGNPVEASIEPWSVWEKTYGNDVNVKMYPGFILGVRF